MDRFFDFITAVGLNWIDSFRGDITRYAIAAPLAWLLICVVLAPLLKGRKIRPDTPPMRQAVMELVCSVRSVAVFSTVSVALFVMNRSGLLWGQQLREGQGGLAWFVGGFALTVLAHDAYFYWAHRAMHHPRLFRVFHRRHHRSNNPTPFTAYSFDLAEAAVMASFSVIWLTMAPIAWPAFGVFMLHQIARNVLAHSGYELFPARGDGRPLFDWMTSVTHHDLHHAQAGYNYGLYFTWWDRLMGTEHPHYHARFAAAVRKPSAERAPVGLAAPAARSQLV